MPFQWFSKMPRRRVDRIVFAVIRRVVCQFQRQLMPIRELDQTLHELHQQNLAISGPLSRSTNSQRTADTRPGGCSTTIPGDLPQSHWYHATCRRPYSVDDCQLPEYQRCRHGVRMMSWSAARRASSRGPRRARELADLHLGSVSSEMRSVSGTWMASECTSRRWSKITGFGEIF